MSFNHLPSKWNLGCLEVMDIANEAAMNVFLNTFFFWNKCTGLQFPDLILCLGFLFVCDEFA